MALTKEKIKEFKEQEKKFEDYCSLLTNVAGDIAKAGDKVWAKKVYKKAEAKAEDCSHYSGLANRIHKILGDKKWAKKVYKKAEAKAEDYSDYSELAESITEDLNDKEWGKKVYKKAEGKVKENDDIRALAKVIYINLGDQKWSNNLYKKAPLTKEEIKEFKATEKDAEGIYDYRSLADAIAGAGDKDWAKKLYKKAEGRPGDCSDFNDLADSIIQNLGDKEWAKELYKTAEEKAEDCSDFRSLADSIFKNLGEKDRAKKFYRKAENKAENFFDCQFLVESILGNLGDKEWTRKVYEKAEEKAEDSFEYEKLAEFINRDLGDKEWAEKVKKGAGLSTFKVSYERSVYYEDGRITQGFITDEKQKSKNIKELIENIENNDKCLSLREDDVINFEIEKTFNISESLIKYYIVDESGKVVHPKKKESFLIIIQDLDDPTDDFLDDDLLSELGYSSASEVPEKKIKDVEKKYRKLMISRLVDGIKECLPKQYIDGKVETFENISGMVLVKFKSRLPLYGINNNVLKLSEDNNLNLKGFDLTRRIRQWYSCGELDSGSFAQGYNATDNFYRDDCVNIEAALKSIATGKSKTIKKNVIKKTVKKAVKKKTTKKKVAKKATKKKTVKKVTKRKAVKKATKKKAVKKLTKKKATKKAKNK
jgi:hypothetical protein